MLVILESCMLFVAGGRGGSVSWSWDVLLLGTHSYFSLTLFGSLFKCHPSRKMFLTLFIKEHSYSHTRPSALFCPKDLSLSVWTPDTYYQVMHLFFIVFLIVMSVLWEQVLWFIAVFSTLEILACDSHSVFMEDRNEPNPVLIVGKRFSICRSWPGVS